MAIQPGIPKLHNASGSTTWTPDALADDADQRSMLLNMPGVEEIEIFLEALVKTGTPTDIRVKIESTPDDGSTWFVNCDGVGTEVTYLKMQNPVAGSKYSVRTPIMSGRFRIIMENYTPTPAGNYCTFEVRVEKAISKRSVV